MKLRWVILVLVAAALVGCRGLMRPPQPPVVAEKLTPEQLLAQLRARRGELQAFEAKGRLTLISPEQNATGTALVKGKFPETLRVDLRDPLGRSVLSFYTNGRTVEIFFPRENKFFQGPATPGNLAAFLPPGVKPSQAMRLMVGDLPLSPGPPSRLKAEAGDYLLEWLISDGSPQERLWVTADQLQPRKEEWYGADGRLAFSAELAEFDRLAPGRPQQVKLVTAGSQVDLRLTYKEFTPNPSLTQGDLALPKPPGAAVQPLRP